MALFRALESVRPPGRRLFEDPFAIRFLRPRLRLLVSLSRLAPAGRLIHELIDSRGPGARTSAVARTRFMDDVVERSLADGVAQVVILGAGFDARPYRMPSMARALVFEVDHPATSAVKQATMRAALGREPTHVRFVEVDFQTDSLAAAMPARGYLEERPTLFVWEGVTNYLSEAAVSETLAWCAAAAPGSRLLFTYVDRRVLEAPESFHGTAKLFATLKASGERWTFGLDPAAAAGFLAERGLALELDRGAAEYRAQCYGPEADRMRGYEFYRIALARVRRETL
jgi:methyltransferase (TIGR00027 family)